MLTTLPRSPNLVPYPHSTLIYPKPLKKSSPKVKESRVDSEGEVHPFSPCCTKRNYSTRIGHERTAGHAQNVLYSGRRKDRERERKKRYRYDRESGPRISNLARRDEVTRETSTQLDDFRPGMREPRTSRIFTTFVANINIHDVHGANPTARPLSARGRGLTAQSLLPVGRAGRGQP